MPLFLNWEDAHDYEQRKQNSERPAKQEKFQPTVYSVKPSEIDVDQHVLLVVPQKDWSNDFATSIKTYVPNTKITEISTFPEAEKWVKHELSSLDLIIVSEHMDPSFAGYHGVGFASQVRNLLYMGPMLYFWFHDDFAYAKEKQCFDGYFDVPVLEETWKSIVQKYLE